MSSYSRSYYLQNQNRLQENQKKYEFEKYNSDTGFKLIKRYQSRIDNNFGCGKYKAEELLSCSKAFFKTYIEFCLKDTNRASMNLELLDLHHINAIHNEPMNLDLWHWTNILPVTEEENLRQGIKRDKDQETIHRKRIIRFLRSVVIQ